MFLIHSRSGDLSTCGLHVKVYERGPDHVRDPLTRLGCGRSPCTTTHVSTPTAGFSGTDTFNCRSVGLPPRNRSLEQIGRGASPRRSATPAASPRNHRCPRRQTRRRDLRGLGTGHPRGQPLVLTRPPPADKPGRGLEHHRRQWDFDYDGANLRGIRIPTTLTRPRPTSSDNTGITWSRVA